MRKLLALILLCASSLVCAETQTRWFVVSVDGKKIGHQRSELDIGAELIQQTEALDIVIERDGQKATLFTETVTEESASGKPIGFALRYRASAREVLTRGKVVGKKIEITESVDGKVVNSRTISLSSNALFPYAQIKKLQQSGLKPGTEVRFFAFDPSVMQSFEVITTFAGLQQVKTLLGQQNLITVKQRLLIKDAEVQSEGLVDSAFTLYRLDTSIGGLKMRVEAAPRALALAANDQSTFFLSQFANAPRAISAKEESQGVFYRARFKTPTKSLPPQTHEQRVFATDVGVDVLVCKNCGRGQKGDDSPAALKAARTATVWLQSEDPNLKTAAIRAVKSARNDLQKMQLLEAFVKNHISDSNLNTGYASAKEAFERKTGDCTENALLLAAMGRSVGIATRVVGGIAYASNYLGQNDVFVPHAWTQAYINRRWQSFDAALGFDAGHIALSVGDGNPNTDNVSGAALLGNLEFVRIDPVNQSKASSK
jgi:Transglutaminase-like superfamily